MLTLILFIVILGILVFVHELGHFVVAKRSGMAVEEFGFGFPPRLFGIKKGDTVYSINWIPLGGFVRIVGEDGDNRDNPKSFGSKSFGRKIAVLVAGVVMNVLFAWVLISGGMIAGLPTVVEEGEQLPASAKLKDVSVAILEVAPGTPAEAAGLKVGDSIYKVSDKMVGSIDDAQMFTKESAGRETNYVFKRGNDLIDKTITPRANPPEGEGSLGIVLASVGRVSYPWYEAIVRGFTATWNLLSATVSAFGDIIGRAISGENVGNVLSGPVGIAVLTGDVADLGWIYLLQFTAVLSINLAIINAVPFPALDGGRVLFLIIEKIRGRKLPEKAEALANTAGFALLLMLMVFVTVKDFGRFEIIDKVKNLF